MKTDRGTIRRVHPDEIERLSSLIRNTLLISNSLDYDMRIIQNLSRQYSPGYLRDLALRRHMYVHLTGDTIDGTISLKGDAIYAFFVAPDKQREGIGSRLLTFVEELARTTGIRRLKVDASVTARAFYEHHGYRALRKERDYSYGAVFFMQKDLV